MKKKTIYLIGLLLLLFTMPELRASEATEEKPFNPKEAIFEHLLDEYGWKIPLTHYHLELPVIVKDFKGEWHLFCSSHLREGNTHKGFYIATEGVNKGKIEALDDSGLIYRPFDISVTKNVLALMVAAILLCISMIPLSRYYKKKGFKAPRKGLGILEMIAEMIYRDVILALLGKEARRYAPYLLTLFFFILFVNLLGMIVIFPGGANLTGNISITLVLAALTFIIVNVFGTKDYWKEIFWPDVPTWLKCPIPIIPVIELFGIFTKPVALMIRLFANMMGGHLILLVLISLIFIFGAMGAVVMGATAVVSVIFSVFMSLIDFLICFIQAYVFTMLTTLFISMGRVKEEHHQPEKNNKINV